VPVSHLDLYRFAGVSQAEVGRPRAYFDDAVTFVEWPEAGAACCRRPVFACASRHSGPRATSYRDRGVLILAFALPRSIATSALVRGENGLGERTTTPVPYSRTSMHSFREATSPRASLTRSPSGSGRAASPAYAMGLAAARGLRALARHSGRGSLDAGRTRGGAPDAVPLVDAKAAQGSSSSKNGRDRRAAARHSRRRTDLRRRRGGSLSRAPRAHGEPRCRRTTAELHRPRAAFTPGSRATSAPPTSWSRSTCARRRRTDCRRENCSRHPPGWRSADLNAIEQIERRSYPSRGHARMLQASLPRPTSLCLGASKDDQLAGLSDHFALRRRMACDEHRVAPQWSARRGIATAAAPERSSSKPRTPAARATRR